MSALYSCLKGKNDTIMATNPTDGSQTVETEDVHEDSPAAGKKKSKFQAFKKFFVKKKRKASASPSGENNLKPSQSISDLNVSGAKTTDFHPAQESGEKGNMGNKAVSHDSVFISEPENATAVHSSQENIAGKVKALQLQLQQNIRIGSPLQITVPKKLDDSGALSEDDGLPRSPPEITSLHEILAQTSSKSSNLAQRRSSLSLGGTDSEEEQISSETTSRPISPLNASILSCPTSPASYLLPVDFASPASTVNCLDNSAAKHKIAVKPKKQRGPDLKQKIGEKPKGENMLDSGKNAADLEESYKEEKSTGDSVPDGPELDITSGGTISNREESKELPKEESIQANSITSSFEEQTLENQDEVGSSETKEGSQNISSQFGNQVEPLCEDMESRDKNVQAVETRDLLPPCEQTIIDQTVHISRTESIVVEATDHDVDANNEVEVLDTSIENHDILVTPVTENIQINEGEEHENSDMDLKEIDRLTANKESDVDVNDTSAPCTGSPETNLKAAASIEDISSEVDEDDSGSFVTDDSVGTAKEETQISPVVETELRKLASDQLIPNIECDKSDFKDLMIVQKTVDGEHIDLEIKKGNAEETKSTVESNLGDLCLVGSDVSREKPILIKTYCETEVFEESKSTDAPKPTTKPVRFTVAPAWQRSLSGGAKTKDSTFERNITVNTVKSEFFEGAVNPQEIKPTSNLHDQKKSEKHIEQTKINAEESSVLFGVRLKSTSIPSKYCSESTGESVKLGCTSIDVVLSAPIQNIPNPTNTEPIRPDTPKMSKVLHAEEEDNQNKTKDIKTEDTSHNPLTEPAWIFMAKLKQRGFQDHPLAREQNPGEKIATNKDRGKGTGESSLKVNIVSSLHNPEMKRNIEPGPIDIPASVPETHAEPEKSTCSAAPQNPNEPPWLSLAKKKAKAWSEMPQIVQ